MSAPEPDDARRPPPAAWADPPPSPTLTGSEALTGVDATVVDFWRFAMSDLRMNNVRGYLAEFLVARAVGAIGTRVEWDFYDVLAPDGTRIEVKSSAYLQAWSQRTLSAIRFTGLSGRTWDPEHGTADDATFNADVYVFAVQTAQTHDAYDPLDVDQWRFYVLGRSTLASRGFHSITLPSLAKLGGEPVSHADLARAIDEANG